MLEQRRQCRQPFREAQGLGLFQQPVALLIGEGGAQRQQQHEQEAGEGVFAPAPGLVRRGRRAIGQQGAGIVIAAGLAEGGQFRLDLIEPGIADGVQGLDQLGGALVAIGGILGQTGVDDGLEKLQFIGQPGNGRGDVLDADGHGRVGIVGHVTGEHVEEHHAEAVDVGAVIGVLALVLLRAHVVGRAQGAAGPGQGVIGLITAGDAEVHQHHAAIAVPDHDVFRLDVAVHVALAGGEVEGAGDVADDADQLPVIQIGPRLRQIAAGDVFHRQVVIALVQADIEHGDDVGMHELADDARFAQEAAGELFAPGLGRVEHLEGDFTLQTFLHGEVDGGHAATAQYPLDLVAGNADLRRRENCFGVLSVHALSPGV